MKIFERGYPLNVGEHSCAICNIKNDVQDICTNFINSEFVGPLGQYELLVAEKPTCADCCTGW